MIAKWNDVVTDEDTVYMLGDIFLGNHHNELKGILSRLKGTKILILGNHDHLTPWQYIECGIMSVHTYLQVTLADGEVVNLIHDPAPATISKEIMPNRWFCGHIHTLFKELDNGRVVNVGVDVNEFKPISEQELMKK
jgi:calcineurin-like phosphoesterase family protein